MQKLCCVCTRQHPLPVWSHKFVLSSTLISQPILIHFGGNCIKLINDDCPANEEELIKSVEKAYGEYPYRKLNRVWLTLQSCLNMIIENDGGNDYKIPHLGKESMERRGLLPRVLDVTPAATAWLNPTMDDNSSLDADDLDDEAHVPTTTATPMIEMDGEEGENTTTDEITNTGV